MDMTLITPEKALQRELSTLSKHMSTRMVQQICCCLRSSHALTDYEVQLICAKATDTLQAACLMQTLVRKGRMPCRLFFHCLFACSPSLFHTISRGTVGAADEQQVHQHVKDLSFSATSSMVPSCIINIHNSSLTNCIIGSNSHLCCLLSKTKELDGQKEQMNHIDQPTPAPDSRDAQTIQMEYSKVEYVIIGDNNYMSIGGDPDSEPQEDVGSKHEDLDGWRE